jgi:hypothetical protein
MGHAGARPSPHSRGWPANPRQQRGEWAGGAMQWKGRSRIVEQWGQWC